MVADQFGTEELPLGIPPKEVKAKRQRSKKDEDDETRLAYRRVRSARRSLCDDCVTDREDGRKGGVGSAAYMRISSDGVRYLCFRHTNVWREKDDLGALRGG